MNIATDIEFKENIDHYLKVMEDGGEVVVTKNGKNIGKFVPETIYDENIEVTTEKPRKNFEEIMQALTGVLKSKEDYKTLKDRYLREKYELAS